MPVPPLTRPCSATDWLPLTVERLQALPGHTLAASEVEEAKEATDDHCTSGRHHFDAASDDQCPITVTASARMTDVNKGRAVAVAPEK